MILRYRWNGNFSAAQLGDHIAPGFTPTVQQIGPFVFVDIDVTPTPTAAAKQDLDEYMAVLGWVFVATDPTTPTNSVNCTVSVYDATGGQAFTGTVPILFDTVAKNMSTGLYTFDSVAGTVEVLEAGTYEISFDSSLNTSSNTRVSSRSYFTKNGVFVPGTNAYGYHRSSTTGLNTSSATTVVDLAVNDVVGVNAERLGATGTVLTTVSGSRMTLCKVAQ